MIDTFEGLVERGSPEEFLLRQIDPGRLPRHIAVIMDGNGRWANKRNKPRVSGHRAGATSVRETVETSARLGIRNLTLYAFSTENWKRPRLEVDTLMRLLREYLEDLGGQPAGPVSEDDSTGTTDTLKADGWEASLTQLEDFRVGGLHSGQVRLTVTGDPDEVRGMLSRLAPRLFRGGG